VNVSTASIVISGVTKARSIFGEVNGCFSEWTGFIKQIDIDDQKNGVQKAMTKIIPTLALKVKQLSWISMPKMATQSSEKGRGMTAVMVTFTDTSQTDQKVIMLIDRAGVK